MGYPACGGEQVQCSPCGLLGQEVVAFLGCHSGLSYTEKGGMPGKFQCGRMCLVLWIRVVWASHETQKGWVDLKYDREAK